MIKTERTEKEQQRKRRNAIVLSDDDDAKAPAPADKFPEQLEAYFVRNGLPVVYSSKSSIVFDRSGKFDGELYLSCGGDVEQATASQGDRRRRRLTPHDGHSSSAQRPFDSANMYDDSSASLTMCLLPFLSRSREQWFCGVAGR